MQVKLLKMLLVSLTLGLTQVALAVSNEKLLDVLEQQETGGMPEHLRDIAKGDLRKNGKFLAHGRFQIRYIFFVEAYKAEWFLKNGTIRGFKNPSTNQWIMETKNPAICRRLIKSLWKRKGCVTIEQRVKVFNYREKYLSDIKKRLKK